LCAEDKEISMSLTFVDRVAIVTGSGSGLGRAYALELARRGAKVVISDLDGSAAERVTQEVQAAGGTAIAHTGSVTDNADVERMVRGAVSEWGLLDVVVNNAGVGPQLNVFEKQPDSEWARVLPVHIAGPVNVLRNAWPHLEKSDSPRIVNVSSSAMLGMDGGTTYATAKAGVLGLTRNLAYECRGTKFRVNAVMPFGLSGFAGSEDYWARFDENFGLASGTGIARFRAEAVAAGVVLLCHSTVPCSGEVFAIGGGRMVRIIIAATRGADADSPEGFLEQWERIFNAGDTELLADADAVKRVLLPRGADS
jgi:NAD(P)-dependent dehydrogenase (short-subunit alcohol dehydrogenase family)